MSNQITKIVATIILFSLLTIQGYSKGRNTSYISLKGESFVEAYIGTQASGIRKEDYVTSNYTPYIQVGIGKWFNRAMALSLNYQGPYFNFIGDNDRHNYFYFDIQGRLNLNELLASRRNFRWYIEGVLGVGYLQNYYLKKHNTCATIGAIGGFKVNNNLFLNLKVSGIIGWAIYQHDRDILTNISIGARYKIPHTK